MTTHMDTLAEWFDNGETGTFTPGDVIISKNDDEYVITTINRSGTINPGEPDRILHRAPKPKPAWHNAVAVTADVGRIDGARRVLAKDENGIWNDALSGHGYTAGHLRDVTPLIEAKVTDEMVQRFVDADTDGSEDISYLLAVALGIDPE